MANASHVFGPVHVQSIFIGVAMKTSRFLPIMAAVLVFKTTFAAPLPNEDIEVKVQITGENVIVDLSLVVAATRQQVWEVLTDFEHMSSFVPNLKESKVIGTSGSELKVFQRGSASYGPIDFPFESTREIRLTHFEKIQSHMISGNVRKMDGITELVEEGDNTRIVYHTDSVPGCWIPPIAGRHFIEHETREQFQELRDEILRRKLSFVALNN
jgi:carbon monoxide dehydrogenase subunit G